MSSTSPFSSLRRLVYRPVHLMHRLVNLAGDPTQSYSGIQERKSRLTIWRENISWIMKNKEINRYYYVYGMDRRGGPTEQHIIPYREFRRLRDKGNLRPEGINFNYACLLRDKFVFGQFLGSLGFPTPRNLALLDPSGITWLDTMTTRKWTDPQLTEGRVADAFCKLLTGLKGEGAFPLAVRNNKIFSLNDEWPALKLQAAIDSSYLLQERISQHPDMARLHPSSVNTIRLITFNNGGDVKVFCATLRIGTNGRSVDNWASGGIVVAIDLEKGELSGEGYFKPGYGGKVTEHPQTGQQLNGYTIPYFQEGVLMACELHRYLYGLHSIGWDIAITPTGPVFVEGNEDWDGSIPMTIEKNFRQRFLAMFPEK